MRFFHLATNVAVVSLCLVSYPLLAETLIDLPPEMRLLRGTTDAGSLEGGGAVTISKTMPEDLPVTILAQLKSSLAACYNNTDLIGSINIYAWTPVISGNDVRYMVDYGPLVNVPLVGKSCETNPICTTEGCVIKGFTMGPDGSWRQDFDTRAFFMHYIPRNDDSQDKRPIIEMFSNRADCTEVGGFREKKWCRRVFIWRAWGLSVYEE